MMSIAVIGNCNIHGVGRAVRALTGADVRLYGATAFDGKTPPEAAHELASHDFVVAIDFEDRFAGGTAALQAEMGDRLLAMPPFVFGAFQPDMGMMRHRTQEGEKTVFSPVGGSGSALVGFGFLNKLTLEQTRRLFCREVFQKLVYLDQWAACVANFKARFGDHYGQYIVKWSRRGCFTYTFNHPMSFVIFDITKETLGDRVVHRVDDLDRLLPDDLRSSTIWPVYPEIAEQYGIAGNYWFKPHTEDRLLDLDAFISESYAIYNAYKIEELTCWPVSRWPQETTEFLLNVAKARR